MHFDLVKILHEMDWMARGVTGVLLLMGVASLAVYIERLLAYGRSRRQSRAFAAAAAKLVAAGDYRKLADVADGHQGGHLARAIGPAAKMYVESADDVVESAVEATRRELLRRHEDAGVDLRRGLSVLASMGSIAPFVGLLGTVVGIIAAFSKISSTGSGGLGSVAGGISEALVVTALGLMVAIPAVLLYNNLSGQADRIHQGLSTSIGQFIDHLELRRKKLGRPTVNDLPHEGPQHAAHPDLRTA